MLAEWHEYVEFKLRISIWMVWLKKHHPTKGACCKDIIYSFTALDRWLVFPITWNFNRFNASNLKAPFLGSWIIQFSLADAVGLRPAAVPIRWCVRSELWGILFHSLELNVYLKNYNQFKIFRINMQECVSLSRLKCVVEINSATYSCICNFHIPLSGSY